GDTLTLTGVEQIREQPVHLEGDTVVFEPQPGFVNPSYNAYFRYGVGDGHGGTASGVVLVKITDAPAAPSCPARSLQTTAGTQLAGTLSCTDANGDALTYSVADPPVQGTVDVQPGGAFTYTPPAGMTSGTVTFTYRASDGTLASDPATVTIQIVGGNTAPSCAPASFETNEDTPLSGTVSCTDPDGDALTYALVAGTAHGTIVLNSGGTFTYTPGDGYHGPDSFTIRASDGTATSNVATQSITIDPVNDAPSAAD